MTSEVKDRLDTVTGNAIGPRGHSAGTGARRQANTAPAQADRDAGGIDPLRLKIRKEVATLEAFASRRSSGACSRGSLCDPADAGAAYGRRVPDVGTYGVSERLSVYRDRSRDRILQWDIIDGELKRAFFRNKFEKSLNAEWTPPSGPGRTPDFCPF